MHNTPKKTNTPTYDHPVIVEVITINPQVEAYIIYVGDFHIYSCGVIFSGLLTFVDDVLVKSLYQWEFCFKLNLNPIKIMLLTR